MDWKAWLVGSLAAWIAATAGSFNVIQAVRARHRQQREHLDLERARLIDALRVLLWQFEHPPEVGFDYSANPDLRRDLIAESLRTRGLLSEGEAKALRDLEPHLLEAQRLFDEAHSGMSANVQWRQRFPAVRERVIRGLRGALRTCDGAGS